MTDQEIYNETTSQIAAVAARGYCRVTVLGATWVRLEPGQKVVMETALDTQHALGFRDGFEAACGIKIRAPRHE